MSLEDRKNFDSRVTYEMHDAVLPKQYLANVVAALFKNNPTGERGSPDSLAGCDQLLNPPSRRTRC